MSARRSEPPAECAICGAELPRTAKACPECGADERTGWREQSIYDGLDLPDDEPATPQFDERRVGQLPWYWIVAGALTLAALIILTLRLG